MERSTISRHEVIVYRALRDRSDAWLTNRDLATHAEGVAPRTVRAHTMKLVKLGLVDQAEVFPGHRYRWSAKASKRNPAYAQRLQQASEVFGE